MGTHHDATCEERGPPEQVSFGEAVRTWARIGLLSFGGPAGQIAVMHRILVEEKRWVDEARFLHALGYCTVLPGPEAMQLATYLGWLLHRTKGGIVAGVLFVLPGFVALMALSLVYATLHEVPAIGALFFGLKCAVLALVADAAVRVGKRALRSRGAAVIAVASFVALFFFDVPFPLVVLVAGACGYGLGRFLPQWAAPAPSANVEAAQKSTLDVMEERGELTHTRPSWARSLRVTLTCLALWAALPVAVGALVGWHTVYIDEALFFSGASLVTFGGAYAVLAYVAQEAVGTYGWLAPGEMLDGLGLAETTPGPLIMVVQFVGMLGAHRAPAGLPPLLGAALGGVVTVWVTFVPCFLWIFLGAPFIESLRKSRAVASVLSGIMAAVVGVIANLSVWFALHVVFTRVAERQLGVLRLLVPDVTSVDLVAVALGTAALIATLRFRVSAGWVLASCAFVGLVVRLVLPP